MSESLDQKDVKPSDYGLVVRNLPADMTKERLKDLIEKKFSQEKVKVAYVNMCYDISGIFKLNQHL